MKFLFILYVFLLSPLAIHAADSLDIDELIRDYSSENPSPLAIAFSNYLLAHEARERDTTPSNVKKHLKEKIIPKFENDIVAHSGLRKAELRKFVTFENLRKIKKLSPILSLEECRDPTSKCGWSIEKIELRAKMLRKHESNAEDISTRVMLLQKTLKRLDREKDESSKRILEESIRLLEEKISIQLELNPDKLAAFYLLLQKE